MNLGEKLIWGGKRTCETVFVLGFAPEGLGAHSLYTNSSLNKPVPPTDLPGGLVAIIAGGGAQAVALISYLALFGVECCIKRFGTPVVTRNGSGENFVVYDATSDDSITSRTDKTEKTEKTDEEKYTDEQKRLLAVLQRDDLTDTSYQALDSEPYGERKKDQ